MIVTILTILAVIVTASATSAVILAAIYAHDRHVWGDQFDGDYFDDLESKGVSK